MTDDPRPLKDNLDLARRHLRSAPGDLPPAPEMVEAVVDFEAVRAERLRLVWHQSIPSRFLHARPAQLPAGAAAQITAWIDLPAPPNLLLTGPVGAGKSWAAVAAVRPAFERGLDVAFWPVADLIEALKPSGPAATWEDVEHVDRLILDDLGAERSTDFAASEVSRLINRRWLDERPIVATTMLDSAQLRGYLGEHTFSRLVGSDALVVALTGEDRRRVH